ncbi:MAG: COX15/CtaA family protein [Verrucomicrobiota bacterium]|nr:COX15/CtaA family protein [Verrucomicrobiota bacterium]
MPESTEVKSKPKNNSPTGTSQYRLGLSIYCWGIFIGTLLLIYTGGYTTSIMAGMVFGDWPLSNGSLNPEGWTENQAMLAEHSHRLMGMTIGFMIIGLVFALWKWESRPWVRKLGWFALGLVIAQGLLGGARVLKNSTEYAAMHGCLAQIFLCLLVTIALVQTRFWHRLMETTSRTGTPLQRKLYRWGHIITGMIFVQLVLGAILRHKGVGLAIPTFPLNPEGTLIPQVWNVGIALNFAHRAMALLISLKLIWWVIKIYGAPIATGIKVLAVLVFFILFMQVGLGMSVIYSQRLPVPTTLHVLNGAILLSMSWGLTFLFSRHRFVDAVSAPTAKETTVKATS